MQLDRLRVASESQSPSLPDFGENPKLVEGGAGAAAIAAVIRAKRKGKTELAMSPKRIRPAMVGTSGVFLSVPATGGPQYFEIEKDAE